MKNIINKVSYVTLLLAVCLVLYFCYLLFWPVKVIDFLEGNYVTTKMQYQVGEPFTYRLHYKKYINSHCTFIRSFCDGILYQLPSVDSCNPIGEHDFINKSLIIPEALPPGVYSLQSILIYKVNPFRNIKYTLETNKFEVISKTSCYEIIDSNIDISFNEGEIV